MKDITPNYSYIKEPIKNYLILDTIHIQCVRQEILDHIKQKDFFDEPFYSSELLRLRRIVHVLLEERRKNFSTLPNMAPRDEIEFLECYHFIRTGYIVPYNDLKDIYPHKYKSFDWYFNYTHS